METTVVQKQQKKMYAFFFCCSYCCHENECEKNSFALKLDKNYMWKTPTTFDVGSVSVNKKKQNTLDNLLRCDELVCCVSQVNGWCFFFCVPRALTHKLCANK